jgi:L-lactate utilization protein LutB
LLALLVSLAALFLAWSAYKRTGGTLDQLPHGLDRSFQVGDADWRSALDKARERLQQHRPEVEDDRNLEQVRKDVEKIRESLAHAFNNAGEAKEKWRDLDGNLERLEAQLREGGSKALATLDETVEKMKK